MATSVIVHGRVAWIARLNHSASGFTCTAVP